jgi:hypothetical protein
MICDIPKDGSRGKEAALSPRLCKAARGASALVPNVPRQSKHESFQEIPQVLWHWRNDERNGIEDLGTVFMGGFAKASKGAEYS